MAVKRGPKREAAPKRTKRKAGTTAKKTPTPKATGKRAPAVLAVPPALANNTSGKLKRSTATRKRRGKNEAGSGRAEASANNKRPVGRPTKYRAEFCDQIRALAIDGLSKAELAFELGISRQCWSEWAEAHAEFGDAIKDAEWISQAWYERKGRLGIDQGKDFNANAWRIQMYNRFSGDYRDRRQVETDVSDGLAGLLRELDGGTGKFR